MHIRHLTWPPNAWHFFGVAVCIGWSKKMAQLLISHKFESGLHSHIKLHTRQFQHVKDLHINFQLNLTKNMEMPDGLKKDI